MPDAEHAKTTTAAVSRPHRRWRQGLQRAEDEPHGPNHGGRQGEWRLGTKRETNKQVKIVINIKLISTCRRKFHGTEREMRASAAAPASTPAPPASPASAPKSASTPVHPISICLLLTDCWQSSYESIYSWISPCLSSVYMPVPCLSLARLTAHVAVVFSGHVVVEKILLSLPCCLPPGGLYKVCFVCSYAKNYRAKQSAEGIACQKLWVNHFLNKVLNTLHCWLI